MANRFILNETSYHGAGAIKSIVDEAKGRSFKKAFVCSDPDLVKFGVTKKARDICRRKLHRKNITECLLLIPAAVLQRRKRKIIPLFLGKNFVHLPSRIRVSQPSLPLCLTAPD